MSFRKMDQNSGAIEQDKPESGVANFMHALGEALQSRWQTVVVFVPYIWLLIFFLAPFFIILKISLAEPLIASPPFSSMIEWAEDGSMSIRLIFENFAYLWDDPLYLDTYLSSVKISGISTILCLLLGYPIEL